MELLFVIDAEETAPGKGGRINLIQVLSPSRDSPSSGRYRISFHCVTVPWYVAPEGWDPDDMQTVFSILPTSKKIENTVPGQNLPRKTWEVVQTDWSLKILMGPLYKDQDTGTSKFLNDA